jgi:hypothetical protein
MMVEDGKLKEDTGQSMQDKTWPLLVAADIDKVCIPPIHMGAGSNEEMNRKDDFWARTEARKPSLLRRISIFRPDI